MVQNQQDLGSGTTINADIASRIITGGQFTDPHIFFGDTYYSENAVLVRTRLYRTNPDLYAPPSNTQHLINALSSTHLVILSAPTYWRSEYESENLAYQMGGRDDVQRQSQKGADSLVPGTQQWREVYVLTNEASGGALLDVLRDTTRKIEGSIILATSVSAEKKVNSAELLHSIIDIARKRNIYIIMTTEEKRLRWEKLLLGQLSTSFFELAENPPYLAADLALTLCKSGSFRDNLHAIRLLANDQPLDPDTQIIGLNHTISSLAEELGSPGQVEQFMIEVNDLVKGRHINADAAINEIKDVLSRLKTQAQEDANVRKRLEAWFTKLEDEVLYLVLAISLVDGLPPETFWAIYEKLTQEAWRERKLELKMTDYLEIEDKISEFVTISSNQGVRFHNSDERRQLVEFALDGYRRSLIQALPVLADIVSGASRPVTTATGSVTGRLRALDIFGSEMEPTGENRQRQERLQTSLANSIAQIALREPTTTEHLLLAWAEGTSSGDSPEVNLRLRFAVTNTLVQMLTIESEKSLTSGNWYEHYSAFETLHRWYSRYYVRDATGLATMGSVGTSFDRRSNVRATMGLALCHLGRYLSEEAFGAFDPNADLLCRVPDHQPHPTGEKGAGQPVTSAWELLLALAWDPDYNVRAGIAPGIKILMQRHPHHAYALLNVLASDWRRPVRETLAGLLSTLFNEQSSNLYLINQLLDQTDALVNRANLRTGHYLQRESLLDESPNFPAHLWTATYAMFLIGVNNQMAFQSYLQTRLASLAGSRVESSPVYKAFNYVLRYVLATPPLQRAMAANVLTDILLDRARNNSPSVASVALANCINSYVQPISIQRNLAEETQRIQKFSWSLVLGYQPPEADPTPDSLTRSLDQIRFSDNAIRDLISYWISRDNPEILLRVRRILKSRRHAS